MIRRVNTLAWILIISSFWHIHTGCTSSEDKVEFVKCKMCGMNAAISEGKFSLYYSDGEVYHTCSGHCAALISALKETELTKAEAFTHDKKEMMDVKTAFFVIGADIIPENSMYPSVFSFSEEQNAQEFQKIHGGEITDFSGVLEMGRKRK